MIAVAEASASTVMAIGVTEPVVGTLVTAPTIALMVGLRFLKEIAVTCCALAAPFHCGGEVSVSRIVPAVMRPKAMIEECE